MIKKLDVKSAAPFKKVSPFIILDHVLNENDKRTVNVCVKEQDTERKEIFIAKIYHEGGKDQNIAERFERFNKVHEKITKNPGISKEPILLAKDYVKSKQSGNIYLFYDYANCKSLADFLSDNVKFDEKEVRKLVVSLTQALQYLLTIGIIHTSVTPDHILVNQIAGGQYQYFLGGIEYCILQEDVSKISSSYFIYNMYAAPELKDDTYDPKMYDKVYSYAIGLIAHNVLMGTEEDPSVDSDVATNIEFVPNVSRHFKLFIRSCITRPKKDQWGFPEITSCGFYKNVTDLLIVIDYFPERYVKKEVIGKGSFGKVVKHFDRITKTEVAVKKVKLPLTEEEKTKKLLKGEVEILRDMKDSPFVVRLVDSFQLKNKIYIVMEYVNGRSLGDFMLKLNRALTEDEIAIVAWSTANALYELHKFNQTMHRDVKAENILVCLDNNRIAGAKLSDFNVSRKYKAEIKGQTYTGTKDYMAPEVLKVKGASEQDKYYTEKADVWSYGILLFFLVTKNTPLELYGEKTYYKKLANEEALIGADFGNFTPEFFDLLNACFLYDINKRYSMENILNHEWFSFLKRGIQTKPDHKPYIFDIKDPLEDIMGRKVYKCTNSENKNTYALVIYSDYKSKGNYQKIERGIHVWRFLKICKYIAKFVDEFEVKNDLCIVREYCDDMTLKQKITKGITSKEIIQIAKQVAEAIKDMHQRHILHRGINPDSIVITESKGVLEKAMIKDFDMARVAYSIVQSSIGSTDIYIAPEYTHDISFNNVFFGTDIWSYGMVLYFMIYGKSPDKCGNDYDTIKKTGKLNKVGEPRAPELVKLMEDCVKFEPDKRPTIQTIEMILTKI